MSLGQRTILIVTGVMCLLFAFFESADGYDSNKWLATALFLSGMVAFYLSARKNPTP